MPISENEGTALLNSSSEKENIEEESSPEPISTRPTSRAGSRNNPLQSVPSFP